MSPEVYFLYRVLSLNLYFLPRLGFFFIGSAWRGGLPGYLSSIYHLIIVAAPCSLSGTGWLAGLLVVCGWATYFISIHIERLYICTKFLLSL